MHVAAEYVTLRVIIITGGMMPSYGLFFSAFAPTVEYRVFTAGILFGKCHFVINFDLLA